TGGPQDGRVADLGHVTLERLVGNGVDGDVGNLIELHVDDICLIHFDFRGDQRHVGDGHHEARGGTLYAGHHGFADAHGQVGDHAIQGCIGNVLLQDIGDAYQAG